MSDQQVVPRAEYDRLREAVDTALGLIETASSRARILRARDVLRLALSTALSEER